MTHLPRHAGAHLLMGALILLAACGEGPLSGGSGTSTDNVITARVLAVDSLAFGLPEGDGGPYPLLVRLDRSHISFETADPQGRDLRFETSDSSPLPFALREWNSVSRFASAWVRLPPATSVSPERILVRWGDTARVGGSDPVAAFSGVSPLVRDAVSRIVLGRFESAPARPELPNSFLWYAGVSVRGRILTPITGAGLAGAFMGDSTGASWVRILYEAPDTQYVVLGVRLAATPRRLGGLDSITFRARGDGVVWVAIEDRRDQTDRRKAWFSVFPDEIWRSYTVRPRDFVPADRWNDGWEAIRDSADTFSFIIQRGSTFDFDDVVLHGISPAELR